MVLYQELIDLLMQQGGNTSFCIPQYKQRNPNDGSVLPLTCLTWINSDIADVANLSAATRVDTDTKQLVLQ